jgi:hypothetical protein
MKAKGPNDSAMVLVHDDESDGSIDADQSVDEHYVD